MGDARQSCGQHAGRRHGLGGFQPMRRGAKTGRARAARIFANTSSASRCSLEPQGNVGSWLEIDRNRSSSSPRVSCISASIVQYFIVSSIVVTATAAAFMRTCQRRPGGGRIACDRNEEKERQPAGACGHQPTAGVIWTLKAMLSP